MNFAYTPIKEDSILKERIYVFSLLIFISFLFLYLLFTYLTSTPGDYGY